MSQDMYYTEVQRIEQIALAKKLQAQELSERQIFEASWCCVAILFCMLVIGFFNY